MSERESAVERLAEAWKSTPDHTPTTYDLGRVDQRHAMTMQLLEAIEADRLAAGVVAEEPEWEYRVAGDGGYRTTPGSLDHAMKCVVGDDRIERRTKEIPAGPWVPVKQEGAETDGATDQS